MEFSLVVARSRLPCCNGATEGGAHTHNGNRGGGTSKDRHDPLPRCSDTRLAHGAGERRPRQGCAVKNRSRKQEFPQGGERSMPSNHAATHVSCKLESGLSWVYSHIPRRRNKSNCEIFHNLRPSQPESVEVPGSTHLLTSSSTLCRWGGLKSTFGLTGDPAPATASRESRRSHRC